MFLFSFRYSLLLVEIHKSLEVLCDVINECPFILSCCSKKPTSSETKIKKEEKRDSSSKSTADNDKSKLDSDSDEPKKKMGPKSKGKPGPARSKPDSESKGDKVVSSPSR